MALSNLIVRFARQRPDAAPTPTPAVIAEACNRLIKNSIICWNYLYLAKQLEKVPDVETKENLLQLIAAHSPMSWAHINMLGEYDFSEEKLRDTLGILPPKKAA